MTLDARGTEMTLTGPAWVVRHGKNRCLFNETKGEVFGRPNAFTVVVTKEDSE
jgi:hypothetical protein